jgi:internalin A
MANEVEILNRWAQNRVKRLRSMYKENISGYENGYVVSDIGNIIALNLHNAKIQDITFLKDLPHLTQLILSSNKISDLSPLKKLDALTDLRLYNNQISDLSPLKELNVLFSLWLSSNQISDLSPLRALKVLHYLDLSSNQISDLSPLIHIKKLKYLYLMNNRISRLPRETLDLNLSIHWEFDESNSGIFLEDNPIKSPPLEIIKQGNEAVHNYFQELDLAAVQTRLLESKLLIVGNGEVGKTTLMRKLKDNTFPVELGKEPTTHGINIEPWEMDCGFDTGQGPRVEKVKLHAWDFGGQEIYHATHQFFLTKRSFYLLVWEARKEDETFSFDYWLNIIRLLGANSPVIVVMNKADVRSKAVDEATYKEKFKNIEIFLQVSCLTGEGIEQLSRQIRVTLGHMPHLQDLLPTVWKQIRFYLKHLEKNHIPLHDYLAICREYGLDEERAEFLSGYLHDLGAILHFRGDPLLEHTVILKPGWATTAVYNLVDTREIQENKGRFNTPDLRKYWDPALFPRELHPQLLRLLEKFELCFPVTGTDIYIVPELLPAQRPPLEADKYKAPGSLHFHYHYDFMPAGIITRFISRMYFLIKEDHYWKGGVELQLEDTYALVSAELPNRRIKIAVTGPHRRELLAIAANDFRHIHRTLNMEKNRHYKELLPCRCIKCKDAAEPRLYEYDVLKDFAAKGKRFIPCYTSAEDVEIETLLKGYEAEQPRQDLLKTLIGAASQLQGLAATLQPDENSRNSFIALLLSTRGFNVKDQTRWGFSATGKSSGIPDIKIEFPETEGVAVIEAFILEGYNRTVIDGHLTRLFGYDPNGNARNFILVYVEAADFAGIWQKYLMHLPEIDFEYKLLEEKQKPGCQRPIEEEPTGFANIKLARVRHLREGAFTEVCHLFIHMKKPF